jgi:hypothetical protein
MKSRKQRLERAKRAAPAMLDFEQLIVAPDLVEAPIKLGGE